MKDKLMWYLAFKMPQKLAYFCTIRLGNYALSGEHAKQDVTQLKFMDVLKRWEKKDATNK